MVSRGSVLKVLADAVELIIDCDIDVPMAVVVALLEAIGGDRPLLPPLGAAPVGGTGVEELEDSCRSRLSFFFIGGNAVTRAAKKAS